MPRVARADVVCLLGALPGLAVMTWWTFAEGGYDPDRWMPGTIVLLLMVAVLVVGRAARRPPRPLGFALLAFAAYTALSYLSILWADAPGAALEGSHRTLGYLAAFALFAVLPWTARAGLVALVGWVLMVGVAGVVTAVRLVDAGDLAGLFLDARLSAPIGYQNAAAALWTMAAAPALVLAARRELPGALRVVLLAETGLLLELALLAQSRGWLFALPLVALGMLAAGPGLVRLLLHALPVGVVLAVAAPTLLEVFDVGRGAVLSEVAGPLARASKNAGEAVLLSTGVLLVAGAALVALDRRVQPPERVARVSGRIAGGVVIVALLVAGVAVSATVDGGPVRGAERAWEDFKDFDQDVGERGRYNTLGSTRYDFWRVGVDVWDDEPLLGIGQDNFAQSYIEGRRAPSEEPRWTHSLELRLLVHTGLLGLLAFAAFALAAATAGVRRARRGAETARAVAGAALLPGLVWLAHGSVDWFWELPALTAPALVFAAVAGTVGAVPATARGGPARNRRVLAVAAVAPAVVAALAVLPVGAAWIAHRNVDLAAREWPADPGRAFERLERARDLEPLSAQPDLVEGVVAAELRDPRRAEAAFLRAARQEPRDWLARFELGLARSALGRERAARVAFEAARERNPLETLIAAALRRVDSPRPLTFAHARAEFDRRVAARQSLTR